MPGSTEFAWPVSVKGVFGPPGRVVLLHNERGEWELPGGRLEPTDTSLAHCLRREIVEELALAVTVIEPALSSWIYQPIPSRSVVIIAFRCELMGEWPDTLTFSSEHDAASLFKVEDVGQIALPDGYRHDIDRANRTTTDRR